MYKESQGRKCLTDNPVIQALMTRANPDERVIITPLTPCTLAARLTRCFNKKRYVSESQYRRASHHRARAYLDAARELGVVEQANRAPDLVRERGDARTPEPKHFHGSGFHIAEQQSAFGVGEEHGVSRMLPAERRKERCRVI